MPRSPGHTLPELLTILVLIGILTAIAAPSVQGTVEGYRVRGVLDRITADLYFARMLAVREGLHVDFILQASPSRCVTGYAIRLRGSETAAQTREIASELPGLCLGHTGRTTLTFDPRGILLPPGRSLFVRRGDRADSVVLSVAGRVRRTY